MMQKSINKQLRSMNIWISAAKKPFFILAACILTAMIPLLLANFNYLDDLGRVAIGYRQWDNYSRYISEFGSILLHAGTHLTDISPLPQILAIIIMAAAGILVIFCLKAEENKNISVFEIIAVLPLAISPYFLECLSYKFDAPYMAFSILVSVFPVWIYKCQGEGIPFCLTSILGTLSMCLSYQAASGIYPMLIALIAFFHWNHGQTKKAVRLVLQAALCYLIGLMIFKFLFMPSIDSYVSTSILPLSQLIPGFFSQLVRYAELIISDFKKIWLLLIVLLFLCFVFLSVRDSKQNRILAFFMSVFTLAITYSLAFGVYPALTVPLEEPRAMFGFGALIAFIAVIVSSAKRTAFPRICAFALSWCFFTFSFTYGNALTEQKRFAESRIQLVLQDLNELPLMNNGTLKVVSINGDIGYAPVVERIPDNQGILSRLVPTLFSDKGWGENYFYCYYGIKDIAMLEDGSYVLDEIDITQLDLPVIKDTMFHTIRGNNEYIVIDLKNNEN